MMIRSSPHRLQRAITTPRQWCPVHACSIGRSSRVCRPKTSAFESTDFPLQSSDDEGDVSPSVIPDVARQNLESAWSVCKQYGWISFWFQLVLTIVAAVVVLFSMAFTSQSPQTSVYLTLFGVVTGFLSTFWSFGYVRLSRKLRQFLDSDGAENAPRVRRTDVINMLK